MYKRTLMKRNRLAPYGFVLPCLIFLVAFIYFPLIQNFVNSFTDYSGLSGKKTFIGFINYLNLFSDPTMKRAVINCIKYAIISVICQVFFGLILAGILEDPDFRKSAIFFRTIYFIPTVISLTVICFLFSFIYSPRNGLLNAFLKLIGLESLTRAWLGKGSTAIYATIAVSQWQSIGYIMMLFIVSIQKIPKEYYEAAEIDGAGKIRKFLNITVPHMREIFFVAMIITVSGSMTVFNEPYILTKGGGPGVSSITMSLYMYQLGFIKDRMGYGSTVAVLIFIISVILAIFQAKLFRTGNED
jgi:raffinose/stachyose/melibiose transport system permease protein